MSTDVAFLTNIPNPYNGDLYEGLSSVGMNVEVRYKGEPTSEGRPWALRSAPGQRVAHTVWDEADLLATSPPSNIVLSGSWASPRDAARRLLSNVAKQRGTAVLVWGEPMSARGGVRGMLRRAYFNPVGVDAILGIGTHAVPSYREATRGGVPIHVFPYTTNSGLGSERRQAPRPVVGFVGRLIDWKGAHIAIWAVHRIPPRDRPELEIVGSGPLDRQLRDLAERLGVAATFHGEVDKARLEEIRSRWWLGLAPSQEVDGWGLVVPEAMNSGLPVVASGFVGAAIDMVRDGINGSLVPRSRAFDPDSWAEAIQVTLDMDQGDSSTNARTTGEAFSARRAAPWLKELLDGDLRHESSFVADSWERIGAGGHLADVPTEAS